MRGMLVQMDETNGRVCLFQIDDRERDTKMEECRALPGKGVDVDDAKCFDQICNLKRFVESYLQDEEFIKLPTHKKWCKYFDQSKNITCNSEILMIVQFFFAVTSHSGLNRETS